MLSQRRIADSVKPRRGAAASVRYLRVYSRVGKGIHQQKERKEVGKDSGNGKGKCRKIGKPAYKRLQ